MAAIAFACTLVVMALCAWGFWCVNGEEILDFLCSRIAAMLFLKCNLKSICLRRGATRTYLKLFKRYHDNLVALPVTLVSRCLPKHLRWHKKQVISCGYSDVNEQEPICFLEIQGAAGRLLLGNGGIRG